VTEIDSGDDSAFETLAEMLGIAEQEHSLPCNTASQWAELSPLAYTDDQSTQVTGVYMLQNLGEAGDLLLEDRGSDAERSAGRRLGPDQSGHRPGP
jgi:hypothetical protein